MGVGKSAGLPERSAQRPNFQFVHVWSHLDTQGVYHGPGQHPAYTIRFDDLGQHGAPGGHRPRLAVLQGQYPPCQLQYGQRHFQRGDGGARQGLFRSLSDLVGRLDWRIFLLPQEIGKLETWG